MTIPGVGPVVALTYRATVDVPARFKSSKAVGAVHNVRPHRNGLPHGKRPSVCHLKSLCRWFVNPQRVRHSAAWY
jgi:hypothetical protein